MGPILALAVLLYTGAGGGGSEQGAQPVGVAERSQLTARLRARGLIIVEHALNEALRARAEGWRMIDELAFLSRGKSALERGRQAHERVELEEAARQLAAAEAAYSAGLGAPGVGSLAAEAALELGVTLGELGRLDAARAAFARSLALSPSLSLTERHARPDVVRLFREVAIALRSQASSSSQVDTFPPAHPEPDPRTARLVSLRAAPSQLGIVTLLDGLGLEAALVFASAADGHGLLAARVEPGCSSEVVALGEAQSAGLDAALDALLASPCSERELGLRLDDPRLAARPPLAIVAPRHAPPHPRRAWPYVVGGSLAVAAAVLGVTLGLVLADPRYSLRVDGASFGAR